MEHLLDDSKFEQAAKLCPRLLKGDGEAWERWVYMFAQARQLPVLAPYIPVQEPRLRKMAYEVSSAALLSPGTGSRG